MADDEQDDLEVGYKKPPKKTQFKKGVSGNPKGRPKGSKSVHALMLEDGRQLVRVNGPHGPRMISKRQAAIMQLGNKAAQGEHRAIREYPQQLQFAEQSEQAGEAKSILQERDGPVMQDLMERIRRSDHEPLNSLPADSPETTEESI